MRGDFWRRLKLTWLSRSDIEAEVADELAFHMEMRERELVEAGVPAEEAARRAREAFGDAEETRRAYVHRRGRDLRRSRIHSWVIELGQDLRFGLRGLRKRPAFATTAIVVLALGIGAPTTVFTLVETIFFQRPAHVDEPHRLVRVFRSWEPGVGGGSLQHADYLYYRERAATLEGLAAYGGDGEASYRIGAGEPGQLTILHVSDNYFDVLGAGPAVGRSFRPEESSVPGRDAVVVLSHGFWSRAFGAEPEAVGRQITLNGIPFTVVGVAPEGFAGVSPVETAPDAWVPLAMFGALNRISSDDSAWWERHPDFLSRWLDVIGRVADGVTVEAARDNLVGLAEALEHPHKGEMESVMVTRQFLYRPSQEESLATLSRVLLGVVAIVLLVAASNVAVLLLSRATTRYREMGIRTAIGAGRGRVARQMIAESVLLGALGGALGAASAYLFADAAAAFLPLPFDTQFVPDATVLALAALLTLLTSVVVGLAPALHAAAHDPGAIMEERGRPSGAAHLRNALVVGQVALSVILVAGAVLFGRSYWTANSEDLGFRRDGVLVARVDLQSLGYDATTTPTFAREAVARLAGLPGVEDVSTSNRIPFRGDWSSEIPAPDGATPNAPDGMIWLGINAVGPDYFDVMGIDVVRGRPITSADRADADPVAVINETLAELLWPGQDPLGRIVPELGTPFRVVGVVGDATYYELGEEPTTQLYLSDGQRPQSSVHFMVRTEGGAAALAPAVQAALRELDPDLAFGWVTTLDEVVSDEVARYEVSAVLVSLFGLIALLLSAAGLYGVVAFTVSRRTREIGVRMALGADRARVARGVLTSGLRLAALGIVVGVLASLALQRFTAGMLYGVEPGDPWTLPVAALTLLTVTAAASVVPARRATAVDPVEAIRAE